MDSSKLEMLGWAPSVTWEDGLARTIAWYKENVQYWPAIDNALLPHPHANSSSRVALEATNQLQAAAAQQAKLQQWTDPRAAQRKRQQLYDSSHNADATACGGGNGSHGGGSFDGSDHVSFGAAMFSSLVFRGVGIAIGGTVGFQLAQQGR